MYKSLLKKIDFAAYVISRAQFRTEKERPTTFANLLIEEQLAEKQQCFSN